MECQRPSPKRRPSILDQPSFRISNRDFTKAPSTLQNENPGLQQGRTQREDLVSHNSGSKITNPFECQPYYTEIPAKNTSMSPLSSSVTVHDLYFSRKSNEISSTRQMSSQQPSILILKSRTSETSSSPRLPDPTKTHPGIPQRRASPLPLSKIRALKSTYDTLNPDKSRDYLDQIRLSKALSFNSHLQGILDNMLMFSELPFSEKDDVSSAQTSWMDGRIARDERLALRLTQWGLLPETIDRSAQSQMTEGTPYIVRCGEQGSGLPVLVRWTSTEADRFEMYYEYEPMPREVRYLLFENWGTPFGHEGRDWEVDEDGRVWVRERPHRYNRWGRWWILQSSGNGRTAR